MRQRLHRAESQVEFHLQNKQNMEREMKQAFMRSVCKRHNGLTVISTKIMLCVCVCVCVAALNLEAMSMFTTQNHDAMSSLGVKDRAVSRQPASQIAATTNSAETEIGAYLREELPRQQIPKPSMF